MRIWIDADGCPAMAKELVFRASRRLELPVFVVANRDQYVPSSSLITLVRVSAEPDAADQYIVRQLAANDLVITADIPLAAAVVDRQAAAISPRGEVYTANNVNVRLAMRNLMQGLRDRGVVGGGPATLSPVDRQKFAAALDRTLTQLLKEDRST
jgi:uncharacterized protein YaiI (UPF0178 family)